MRSGAVDSRRTQIKDRVTEDRTGPHRPVRFRSNPSADKPDQAEVQGHKLTCAVTKVPKIAQEDDGACGFGRRVI